MHCALFNYTQFQPPTVDYVLVYWSEEDCVSVVLYKRRLAPQSTFMRAKLGESLNSVRLAPAVLYETALATGVYTSMGTSTCRYGRGMGTGTGVEQVGVRVLNR